MQRLAESLDADVKRWSSGKEGNLRALLSTLQYVWSIPAIPYEVHFPAYTFNCTLGEEPSTIANCLLCFTWAQCDINCYC